MFATVMVLVLGGAGRYQDYRADKALLAMRQYQRQAPLIQIVDRRRYGRMLTIYLYEVRHLRFPADPPGCDRLLRPHVSRRHAAGSF